MLWILAELSPESLAIPGADVLEVVPAIAPTPIAGYSKPWMGVIRYRGTIVPVMDLCERLAVPTPSRSMRQRILIMTLDGANKFALRVPSARAMTAEDLSLTQQSTCAPIIRHLTTAEIFAPQYQQMAIEMLKGIQL